MIRLKVSGMTCSHCERAVSQALAGVSGVEEVLEVSHEKGSAEVRGTADPATLIAAVVEEGYQAEVAR